MISLVIRLRPDSQLPQTCSCGQPSTHWVNVDHGKIQEKCAECAERLWQQREQTSRS
jgi:hypothetical protein